MRNKLIEDRRAKCRERTQHQNIYWRMTIASYGNRTHVNSLEGYYATTTPTMLTSRVVIKQWETNWLKIGEQSAERERSTKTIANGWQLHRTGIEPMSKAWKATMLPLHQRCSHQELWLNNENKLIEDRRAKCRERTQHQNNRQRMTIASYGNRTHVNSLEGYYATTTPTMLTSRVVIKQGMRNKLIEDRRAKCREITQHQNNRQRMTIASYGNRTHVNSLEGYYATTTPTTLTSRVVIKQWETNWLKIGEQSAERERSTKTFTDGWQLHRTGIEPMSIAWKATMLPLHQRCSHQELWLNNETNWLKIGEQSAERERSTKTFTDGWQLHRTGIEPMSIAWKATMLPLHQRCSRQELWLNNEKQTDWRSESKVQRENAAPKYLLTEDNCIVRESNPCQKLGRLLCYHYTNDAHIKSCD